MRYHLNSHGTAWGDAFGPRCDPFGAQPLRVFVQASHHYREEGLMTQQEFDRRFHLVVRIGFGMLLFGIASMMVVGLSMALLADDFRAFFGFVAIGCAGGSICVSAFAWDIFCNPRWK